MTRERSEAERTSLMGYSPRNTSTLSGWKKACFGILATSLFFFALEGTLALFDVRPLIADRDPYIGFETAIPLFVEGSHDGQAVMQTASNKLRYFNSQQFAKAKAPDTLRVFCLGGSTTFGRPFDDRTSFVGWLRELLPMADDDRNWEVINAGGVSYASYRVASVMDELVKYSPDLFVIYTGHNEFLEERTYHDLKQESPTIRRLVSPLLQTRSYSIARHLLTTDSANSETRSLLPGEVDAILDHSVGPDAYRRDDQLRSKVLEHFQFNLNRMVDSARSVGAMVVLVTPAANMKDFSPFKSEHVDGLDQKQLQRFSKLITSAEEAEASSDLDTALSILQEAANIDNGRADLNYRIAKLQFAMGQFDAAQESFQRAIDEDICPLRAPHAIQRAVEQVAIDRRVPLVDFHGIVSGDCLATLGHGCPGREYFLDHVHPTVAGHRLMSLAIIEAMSQSGMISYGAQWNQAAITLATQRIESRIDPELQARALTNLAQVLGWAGKQHEAGPIAEQAVRLRLKANLREDPEGMFYAAVSYAVRGRDTEAIDLLQRVVELEPNDTQSRWRLAALLYDQQRFEDSLVHFREAVRLDPEDIYSHQMLGTVLIKLARYDDALAALIQATKFAPDDPVIRENMEAARKKIAGG